MTEICDVFKLLKNSENYLKQNNITEARLDAELLLCYVLKITRNKLLTLKDIEISDEDMATYQSYLKRRTTHEPLAYITNERYFMERKFYVDKNVLIPRQETEFTVDFINRELKDKKDINMLELCTGSGCIAISVACENDIKITASDISVSAINVAQKNAILHGVKDKINFVVSDIFENIDDKKYDVIVSNPPYVTDEEFLNVEKELLFEPKNALVAKDNGLFFYKEIADKGRKYLSDNGIIAVELNSNLSKQIYEIFERQGFKNINIIKDFNNLDRVLTAKWIKY